LERASGVLGQDSASVGLLGQATIEHQLTQEQLGGLFGIENNGFSKQETKQQ